VIFEVNAPAGKVNQVQSRDREGAVTGTCAGLVALAKKPANVCARGIQMN
jgi:glutamine amidotransferase PdxT